MRWVPAATILILTAACNSTPDDLREWRASDHDHTTQPGTDQVAASPDGAPSPELAAHGIDEVTLVAWQQNCTRCHGVIGRGDGPQDMGLRPADLTDPAWQRSAKDEQIARTIREGRGEMPAFPLPETTIAGLVRLVRLLDASRSGAPAPSGSVAPAASAKPAASAVPMASQAPANVRAAATATAKGELSDPGQGHTAPAKPQPPSSARP